MTARSPVNRTENAHPESRPAFFCASILLPATCYGKTFPAVGFCDGLAWLSGLKSSEFSLLALIPVLGGSCFLGTAEPREGFPAARSRVRPGLLRWWAVSVGTMAGSAVMPTAVRDPIPRCFGGSLRGIVTVEGARQQRHQRSLPVRAKTRPPAAASGAERLERVPKARPTYLP